MDKVTERMWEVEKLNDNLYDIVIIETPRKWNFVSEAYSQANANLIVTAVNACKSINPDNPLLVAESIEKAFRFLNKVYTEKCMRPIEGAEIPFEWSISEKTITELRTLMFDAGLCNNPINLNRDTPL